MLVLTGDLAVVGVLGQLALASIVAVIAVHVQAQCTREL